MLWSDNVLTWSMLAIYGWHTDLRGNLGGALDGALQVCVCADDWNAKLAFSVSLSLFLSLNCLCIFLFLFLSFSRRQLPSTHLLLLLLHRTHHKVAPSHHTPLITP